MNITRRELLGGAIGVMSAASAEKLCFPLGEMPRNMDLRDGKFPIVWLVLGEKRNCWGAPQPWSGVKRLVSVDLENEEEWGDINSVYVDGQLRFGLGNDEDGYWMIEHVFEIVEPTTELHEEKYPVSFEMPLDDFGMLIEKRVNTWLGLCD